MAKAVAPRRNSHGSAKQDDQIFSFSRKKATEFFRRECEVRRENSEEFAKPKAVVAGRNNRKYESAEPFLDGEYHVHEPGYRFRTTGMDSTAGKSLSLDRGHSFEPGEHFSGDSNKQVMPVRPKRTNEERQQKAKSLVPNPAFVEPKDVRRSSRETKYEVASSGCVRPEETHDFHGPRNVCRDAKDTRFPGHLGRQVRSSSVGGESNFPEPRPILQGIKPASNKHRYRVVGGSVDNAKCSSHRNVNTDESNMMCARPSHKTQHESRYASTGHVYQDRKPDSHEHRFSSGQIVLDSKNVNCGLPERNRIVGHAAKVHGSVPVESGHLSTERVHNRRSGVVSQERSSSTLDKNAGGSACSGYSNRETGPRSGDARHIAGNHRSAFRSCRGRSLQPARVRPSSRTVPKEVKCMSLDRRYSSTEARVSLPRTQNPVVPSSPEARESLPQNQNPVVPTEPEIVVNRRPKDSSQRNSFQRPRGRMWNNQYSYNELCSSFQKNSCVEYRDVTDNSVDDSAQVDMYNDQRPTYGSGEQKQALHNQKHRQKPEQSRADQNLMERRHSSQEHSANNEVAAPPKYHHNSWTCSSDAGFSSQHPEYQKGAHEKVDRIPRSMSTLTQDGSCSSGADSGDDGTKVAQNGRKRPPVGAADSKKSSKQVKVPIGQKVTSNSNHRDDKVDANPGRYSHPKVLVGHQIGAASRRKVKLRGFDLLSCCYGIPNSNDRHDNRAGEMEGRQRQVRFGK